MWKLIVFVAGGSIHGAENLVFLDLEECNIAAAKIEQLHDKRMGTSIETVCLEGLFWNSTGE